MKVDYSKFKLGVGLHGGKKDGKKDPGMAAGRK